MMETDSSRFRLQVELEIRKLVAEAARSAEARTHGNFKEKQMAYKILIARADIGGTIENQKAVQGKVASDLESQLNAGVISIASVSVHETDHEFMLVAAVEVEDPEQPAVEQPTQGE